jgi:hypothetical protein
VIDPKLKNWIISIVTGVWALNFIVGLIPSLEYKPDQAINAIFMAIVGGLFAISARRPPEDDKKKELDSKKATKTDEEEP